jgi:hypothetical protein
VPLKLPKCWRVVSKICAVDGYGLEARCWWRSWLRHCATNRKVAVSIPDVVTGIFHLHKYSGRTMALELTQPLTEMSTRNISCRVDAAGA